jgi:hypothetical protein
MAVRSFTALPETVPLLNNDQFPSKPPVSFLGASLARKSLLKMFI